eukprot:2030277-Amphidinium_carterae.1
MASSRWRISRTPSANFSYEMREICAPRIFWFKLVHATLGDDRSPHSPLPPGRRLQPPGTYR